MTRTHVPSRRVLGLLLATPLLAAACASAVGEGPGGASEPPAQAAVATSEAPAPTEAAPETEAEATAEAASWLDIELTDAATGESFTLASLAGSVVALEPMAVWCTNCKAQQDNVKQVYDQIEAAGVRYISLGIDPGENADALAKYAERRGYPWTFVQSSNRLSRALADIFGPQILSAPSTPLIVLDADGEIVLQEFGFHGPDKVLSLLGEATA